MDSRNQSKAFMLRSTGNYFLVSFLDSAGLAAAGFKGVKGFLVTFLSVSLSVFLEDFLGSALAGFLGVKGFLTSALTGFSCFS